MIEIKRVKRDPTKHFLYCLRFDYLLCFESGTQESFRYDDAIYWGMTSNLKERMKQHFEGDVHSTSPDERKNINILYTIAFKTREEAEASEKIAWQKSGYGCGTMYSYAGVVADITSAYRYLLDLGWDGHQIGLRYFLQTMPVYLKLWDIKDTYLKEEKPKNLQQQPLKKLGARARNRQIIKRMILE
ncbi:GIY-YIG nuclease family protein [Nostoc sp. ChiQUE01b]|uniref:GIY-YIG nuclease family protein n=1 Tax=Nostoc sp. ChiQUE01b TaxID=3075376 RepID=UPI002AD328FB|nr:GIY-YIG nuclease family protein [Nostoc sp. ChiQUE01b]MDZ8262053.1 GIY-YIG nuclease family protein [Nostoc sp. ChiQUE01b]